MNVDPSALLDELQSGQASLWAIIIGVNDYQDSRLRNLRFAVADCKGLASVLHEATRPFPATKIICHSGLKEEFANNKAEILETLEQLKREAQPQDTVLFYFSGHADLDPLDKKLYLCCADTQVNNLSNTGFSIEFLLEHLRSLEISKQVIILDACHSGKVGFSRGQSKGTTALLTRSSAEDIPESGDAEIDFGVDGYSNTKSSEESANPDHSDDVTVTPELEAVLRRYSTGDDNFYALLSCRSGEFSYEHPNLAHGVFTHFLIEGLNGNAADYRSDWIHVDNLYTYVRNHTSEFVSRHLGQAQSPNRIAAGHQDIVIGRRSPSALRPIPANASTREREGWYHDEYEKVIFQRGLEVDQVIIERLRNYAAPLDRHAIEEIENRVRRLFQQEYQERLEPYRFNLKKFVERQGIPDRTQIKQLRAQCGIENIKFGEAVIQQIENDVFEPLRQQFRDVYSKALRQHGNPLPSQINQQLNNQLEDWMLGNSEARRIANEEVDRFQQDIQEFKKRTSSTLHYEGKVSEDQLTHWNQEFCFSTEIIQQIYYEQSLVTEQKRAEYSQLITAYLHHYGELNDDFLNSNNSPPVEELKKHKQSLGLGDPLVLKILEEQREILEQHRQEYFHALSADLHQLSQPQYVTLKEKQTQLGLSALLVEQIEQQANEEFENHKQEFLSLILAGLTHLLRKNQYLNDFWGRSAPPKIVQLRKS